MREELDLIQIDSQTTILNSLRRMDEIRHKLLLVNCNGKFKGLLSIGDIQRAIIRNIDLSNPVSNIMRDNYIFARPGDSLDEIKRIMLQIRSEFMPVVDTDSNLINVYYWEDLFGDNKIGPTAKFNLPVVIMAGGYGTRLLPLTNVLPKALLPVGKKTILEEIFDRFAYFGSENFFISLNYKSELIKYYIQNQGLPFHIEYFEEIKPMGTAGSLSLLKGMINQSFFVTNCDILIDQDYSEILAYHLENKNEITVVSVLKHFPISYGTIETGEKGHLKSLTEKPDITFKINSGMYLLEPHLIGEVPENSFYHITDLITSLVVQGRNVGVFPVSQNSWIDIGDWKGYIEFVKNSL